MCLFQLLFFALSLFLGVFLQAITLRHITGRMEVQSPVFTTSRYGGTRVLLTFMVGLMCSGAPLSRCKNWPFKSVHEDRCFFTHRGWESTLDLILDSKYIFFLPLQCNPVCIWKPLAVCWTGHLSRGLLDDKLRFMLAVFQPSGFYYGIPF